MLDHFVHRQRSSVFGITRRFVAQALVLSLGNAIRAWAAAPAQTAVLETATVPFGGSSVFPVPLLWGSLGSRVHLLNGEEN